MPWFTRVHSLTSRTIVVSGTLTTPANYLLFVSGIYKLAWITPFLKSGSILVEGSKSHKSKTEIRSSVKSYQRFLVYLVKITTREIADICSSLNAKNYFLRKRGGGDKQESQNYYFFHKRYF